MPIVKRLPDSSREFRKANCNLSLRSGKLRRIDCRTSINRLSLNVSAWLTPESVACPTLVLHDRADAVVPITHAEWALHCIASAEFCELQAAGHLIWVGRDQDKMRSQRADFIRRHI